MKHITKILLIFKNLRENIIRNWKMSLATIFVVSISLVITLFFIINAISVKKTFDYFKNQSEIIIFFNINTPEDEIQRLNQQLQADPNVLKTVYISKETARDEFMKEYESFTEIEPDSIDAKNFPPNIEITLKDIRKANDLVAQIEAQHNQYITDILHFKKVSDFLARFSKIVDIGAVITIILSFLISLLLVSVTISFNIEVHKDEIEIMKLMGTDRSTIVLPYVLEGALYGFLGATITAIIVNISWIRLINLISNSTIYDNISSTLNQVHLLFLLDPNSHKIFILSTAIIGSGLVIGFLGSIMAVKKQLKYKK